MSEATMYVVAQDFSFNLDNGIKHVDVKVGDELSFDGLYVECRGEKGTARSLAKVVGDWIVAKTANTVVQHKSSMIPPLAQTRNATGGKIVEDSDVSQDLGVKVQQESTHNELKKLVTQYENTPAPTHPSTRTIDDMVDMKKESRVQVENQDAQEVAKVSTKDQTKNTSGVQIQEPPKAKTQVYSQEERVVRNTSYGKKKEAVAAPKHLKVEKEGSGVEVRKVKAPMTHSNTVRTSTAESRAQVSKESEAVIETDYGPETSTEVGSTTQAQIESAKVLSKPVSRPQEPPKREVIREASQDGVVVRKVSKIPEAELRTQDGISSKVTVSSGGQEDPGEVTFSSNTEIDMGEATFSSSEDSVADLGGGDIDVNDILNNV